jgi:hypothetical protein
MNSLCLGFGTASDFLQTCYIVPKLQLPEHLGPMFGQRLYSKALMRPAELEPNTNTEFAETRSAQLCHSAIDGLPI